MGDIVNGVNLLSIKDELLLHEMLDKAEDYEDRKKIRARLKDVLSNMRAEREEIIRHREEEREQSLRNRVKDSDEHKRRTLAMYDAMAKSAPAGGNKVMDINYLREGKEGTPGSPAAVAVDQHGNKLDTVEQAIRQRQNDANDRKARVLAAYDNAAKSGPAGSARFIDFDGVKQDDIKNVQNQPKHSSCFEMSGGVPIAAPVGAPIIFPRSMEDEYDPMEEAIRKRQRESDERKRRTLEAYDKAARSRPAGTPISIYIPVELGVEPVFEVAGRQTRQKLDNPATPMTPPRSRHQFYEHPTQMQPRYKVPGVTEDLDVNHYYRPTNVDVVGYPKVDQEAQNIQTAPATYPNPQTQQYQQPQPQQYRQQYGQQQNQPQQQYGRQQNQPQQQNLSQQQYGRQQQYGQQQNQVQQQYGQQQYQPQQTRPQPQQFQQQQYQQQQHRQTQPPNTQAQQLNAQQYNQAPQYQEQQQQQFKSSHYYQPNQGANQNRNVPTFRPVVPTPPQSGGRVQQQQQQYQQQVNVSSTVKTNAPPPSPQQQQQQARSTATVTLQPQQQQQRQVTQQTTQQTSGGQRTTTTTTTTRQQQYYEEDDEEEEEEEEEDD